MRGRLMSMRRTRLVERRALLVGAVQGTVHASWHVHRTQRTLVTRTCERRASTPQSGAPCNGAHAIWQVPAQRVVTGCRGTHTQSWAACSCLLTAHSPPGSRKLPAVAPGMGLCEQPAVSCLSCGASGALLGCTRLNADMGLSVCRVPPPKGLPVHVMAGCM